MAARPQARGSVQQRGVPSLASILRIDTKGIARQQVGLHNRHLKYHLRSRSWSTNSGVLL